MDLIQFVAKGNFLLNTVIVIFLLKLVEILWNRRHQYFISWKLRGPFALPILGNLHCLPTNVVDILSLVPKYDELYGQLFRFWLGPILVVAVSDPDDVQAVTQSPNSLDKPFIYRFASDWTGNGLVVSECAVWKVRRKIMSQAFTPTLMDHYMSVFNEQCQVLLSEIDRHANTNKYIDIYEYSNRFTLDVACEIVMGIKLQSQLPNAETGEYDNEYIHATDKMMYNLFQRTMRPWLMSDFLYKHSGIYREIQKCCAVFNTLADAVVVQAEERYRTSRLNNNEEKPKTIIDMLVCNNEVNRLSQRDMRDELNTMILGGADTSGHALGFIFLMLAMHPEVQERVYSEIEEHAMGSDVVTKEMLFQLPYLDQVVKETIRLFPLFSAIARMTTGDVQLKSKDITLKKDMLVLLNVDNTHRNKRIWGQDANEFNPDRFSPENSVGRHPASFLGFSSGPRNCIGQKFGRNSMKVVLVAALRKYKFETEEKFHDIQREFNVLLKKTGGWKVKLNYR